MSSYSSRVSPEKISRYLDSNPGTTEAEARRALRGHGHTAEHGVLSEPVRAGGRTVYTTTSAQAAMRVVNQAARNGQRVSFAVNDANNPVTPKAVFENVRPGGATGIDAALIRDGMRANKQNVKQYLEGQTMGEGSRSPGYIPHGITAIQITVYG